MTEKIKVLFVCLGNICRSPTAEGVFTKLVQDKGYHNQISIDSAGTHAYHVGSKPDPRARDAANRRGVKLDHLRARKVEPEDLDEFDYVIAMDHENYHNLVSMSTSDNQKKIQMFLHFAKNANLEEVPDPYYGGEKGFERVLDLVEDASEGLLLTIIQTHSLS